jgi:tRNA U54 and U55 pseudouridine synthase Pus10
MKPKTDTFEVQQGSIGRDFRLSATHIYEGEVHHVFKYLDNDTFFTYYIDENYKPKILNHEKTTDLLCTIYETIKKNFPREQMTP